MRSCRSMLGSESGSNVFDWDGTLASRIDEYRKKNPKTPDLEPYKKFVESVEIDGIMNQISPRIFEAIAAKTALVLFEGSYSGVINAGEHYIPVKKDGTNLAKVMADLEDGNLVDEMVERAYKDIIASGNYSYKSFVNTFDQELKTSMSLISPVASTPLSEVVDTSDLNDSTPITTLPIRARISKKSFIQNGFTMFFWQLIIPEALKVVLQPKIKNFLNKG